MKVLVWFPSKEDENFEGVRLRKSIKGALELKDIIHTSNPIDYYDVAHFLNTKDEGKINECIENNIPVIISCLNCESDPNASFLEYKIDKKGNRIINLSNKTLRILNRATTVIVPSEEARQYLIDNGVEKNIEVISPGVNLSRFNFSREDEKEIFYRYFGEDKSKKIVVSVGNYSKFNGIRTLIKTAKKCPNTKFYYFSNTSKVPFLLQKDIKFAPKNVKFVKMPPDDVYRSALLNATIFFYPGYSFVGVDTLLEAMAAKCQIIIREQPFLSDILKDGENAYICKYSETLTSVVKDWLDGKMIDTSAQSQKIANKHTLEKIGNNLKELYKKAMNIK